MFQRSPAEKNQALGHGIEEVNLLVFRQQDGHGVLRSLHDTAITMTVVDGEHGMGCQVVPRGSIFHDKCPVPALRPIEPFESPGYQGLVVEV